MVVCTILLLDLVPAPLGTSTNYDLFSKYDYGGTGNTSTSSYSQRYISGFEPVSQYSSSSFGGRLGIMGTDFADSIINLTYPLNNGIFARGNESYSGEDDLGIISNTIILRAKIYDKATSTGISDQTCYFYDNLTLLGSSSSNSSGDCIFTYYKSAQSLIDKLIFVNYTYNSGAKLINESQVNISLEKYVMTLTEGGTHSNGKYYNGELASLTITVRKSNTTDTSVLYDVGNITADALNSAGTLRGTLIYPINITRSSKGIYTTSINVTYGAGSDAFIKWNIKISDDNSTFIGSALHADIGVCQGDFGAWSTCSASSQSRSDSTGCTETQSCGGGGGEGGETCSNECTSGETEVRCVSDNTLRTRTCGNYDSDSCTEWNDGSFSDCNTGFICQSAQCVEVVCVENWQCTYPQCSPGQLQTSPPECVDLNSCGTENDKPTDTKPCDECVESWQCDWTECQEGDTTSTPFNCVDSNSCGTENDKPGNKPVSCEEALTIQTTDNKCTNKKFVCSSWSICEADYSINDIVEGKTSVNGVQSRSCEDTSKCAPNKIEKRSCNATIPIEARKVQWCEEEYLDIYVQGTNELVSRVKETEITSKIKRFDIDFVITEFVGYCNFCYNGIKDTSEEDVDCGGPNCQVCIPKYSYFDWLFYVITASWIIFLLLLVLFFRIKRDKDKKTITQKIKEKTLSLIKRKTERKPIFKESIKEKQLENWFAEKLIILRSLFRRKPSLQTGYKVIEKEIKIKSDKDRLADLKRKLKKWRKEGYYGTYKLETEIKELEYKLGKNKKNPLTKIKEYYKVRKEKKKFKAKEIVSKPKIRLFKIKNDGEKRLNKEIKKEKKKARREIRKQKILDLMRKLKLWRRKGYYGTYKLEEELKKLKKIK